MEIIGPTAIDLAKDGEARRREILERIARLIDRPVESLIHGSPPGDEIADAAELISLWLAIRDAGARRRLLAMTRELAEG